MDEIQVKRTKAAKWVVVYTPTNLKITSPIITKGYAEDLAQNAQYHLENYTWFRCDANNYLEYSDKACDWCKDHRWGFITELIREGRLPDVVETKHCDCLLFTPSTACADGQRLHREAEQSNTLEAWELYTRHTRGED